MLNPSKLGLQAAKRLCLEYKYQNKRFYKEHCDALAKIKTAIGNDFELSSAYNNGWDLVLYFVDANNNDITIVFREYAEKRIGETFRKAYYTAKDLNSLCFG